MFSSLWHIWKERGFSYIPDESFPIWPLLPCVVWCTLRLRLLCCRLETGPFCINPHGTTNQDCWWELPSAKIWEVIRPFIAHYWRKNNLWLWQYGLLKVFFSFFFFSLSLSWRMYLWPIFLCDLCSLCDAQPPRWPLHLLFQLPGGNFQMCSFILQSTLLSSYVTCIMPWLS